MTNTEKKLRQDLAKKETELEDARAGLKEINNIVNAILYRIALEYGAKLPDGGMVLTLDRRPSVALLDVYEGRIRDTKDGGYRIVVRRKEKKSEKQGA